jgi:serine/threonine protein kinase
MLLNLLTSIADFGAAITTAPQNTVEETLKGLGSPAFQPPEAQDNTWLSDPMKYDVWSAGVVLYIITVGQFPFEMPNLIVLWNNISKASYVIPDFIGPILTELIEGMLEVDPKSRWAIKKVKKHNWLRRSSSGTPRKTIREYKRSLSKKKIDEIRHTDPEDPEKKDLPEKVTLGSSNGQQNKLDSEQNSSSTSRSLSTSSREQTSEAKENSRGKTYHRPTEIDPVPIVPLQTVFDELTITSIMQSLSNLDRGSNSSDALEDYYSEGRDSDGSASDKRMAIKYIPSSQKERRCSVM